MNFDTWIVFVFTLYAVSIIPGPSMIIALTHGMQYGAKAALATASGNALASCIQAVVSIAGLGVIIATSGTVFMVIKYLGAIYLIYLGIMLWRSPAWYIQNRSQDHKKSQAPLIKMFKQGFIVAIGNPKAIVFFTAIFPQFLTTQSSSFSHYALMVLVTCSSAFICAMLYAIGGNKIAQLCKNSNISKFVNKITGGFFVTGGLGIMLSSR